MTILLTILAACGATPNPVLVNEPVGWSPPPAVERVDLAATTPATEPIASTGAKTSAVPLASTTASAPKRPVQDESTASARAKDAPAGRAPTNTLPIATVAGKPIDVSELLAQWVHHRSAEALDELDHLVLTRLVAAEAARLGVEADAALVQTTYERSVAETEVEIHKRRPNLSLDAWVDQVLGLDPLGYREKLRRDALNQVLAERVTRAFLLQSEHTELRVIVVKTEAEVKAVQEALSKGEAFEEIAKRLSADSSAKDGGRVPPVVRADTAIAKLAFDTQVGAVSEPRYNQGAWLLAKVEARPAPLAGTWAELRPAVEASLAQRGIHELEFSQWRTAMLRRYQVDISPFLRLSGQPVR